MINDANLTQLITFLEYYYAPGAAECIMQCVYCNSQILGISTLHFKTVPCSVKQKTRKRSTRPAMWGTASSAAGISPIPAIMNIKAPSLPRMCHNVSMSDLVSWYSWWLVSLLSGLSPPISLLGPELWPDESLDRKHLKQNKMYIQIYY